MGAALGVMRLFGCFNNAPDETSIIIGVCAFVAVIPSALRCVVGPEMRVHVREHEERP